MEMTSIIPDQPGTAELPKATAKTIAEIQAHIDGLAAATAFVKANAAIAPQYLHFATFQTMLYVFFSGPDTAKELVDAWVSAAADAGVPIAPYADEKYAGVHLSFGPATIQVYANGHLLGRRVQIVSETWQSSVEIPEHARREQPAGGAR